MADMTITVPAAAVWYAAGVLSATVALLALAVAAGRRATGRRG